MKRFSNALACALLCASAATLQARSAGAPANRSGAPGDGLCTDCHTTNAVRVGADNLKMTFAGGTTYVPGQTQRVTVTIDDPNGRRWGFEASPRVSSSPSDTGAGRMTPVDANTQLMPDNGTRQWITHTFAGTRAGTVGPATYVFDWTPPAASVGDIEVFVAANAANNNNLNSGDQIYRTSVVLKPAAAPAPSISSNGVVNGASLRAGMAPGSWISIFGSGLGLNTRTWDAAKEIVDGKLPVSLDGTSVMVNGKPASVYFISPNQLNIQSPDDDSTGPVEVVVTAPGGVSRSTVQLQRVSPSLFPFDAQGRKYAAATAADGTLLGPAGLFGASVTTRPARPGETIILYGTGFGATNPVVPAGAVFTGAAALTATPVVTIGGMSARVAFAGLSGAGLYQFNVVVPDAVANGDQAVVLTAGGQQSPDGVFVSVAR